MTEEVKTKDFIGKTFTDEMHALHALRRNATDSWDYIELFTIIPQTTRLYGIQGVQYVPFIVINGNTFSAIQHTAKLRKGCKLISIEGILLFDDIATLGEVSTY